MEYSGRPFSSARVWIQYTLFVACFIARAAYQRKMLPNTQPANNLKNCSRFMIIVGGRIALCKNQLLWATASLLYWNIYMLVPLWCVSSSRFFIFFFSDDYLGVYWSGVARGRRRVVGSRWGNHKQPHLLLRRILGETADHGCGKGIIIMIIIISTKKNRYCYSTMVVKASQYISEQCYIARGFSMQPHTIPQWWQARGD